MKKLKTWLEDYFHAATLYGRTVLYRDPPKHYLEHIDEQKNPVVIIPGINTKWQFLKLIADEVSKLGHPMYVLEDLGFNRRGIHESAELVRKVIDENDLQQVLILSHSKGGLIAKEALLHFNDDDSIQKVITIATPFQGSKIAKVVPDKVIKELGETSPVIEEHANHPEVNEKIISIYGLYDNHVWPTKSCHLEGAENIRISVDGHHKILSYSKAREIVLEKIAELD